MVKKFVVKKKFNTSMQVPKSNKIPTLTDLRKSIPKGGLMNPGLRVARTKFSAANIKGVL